MYWKFNMFLKNKHIIAYKQVTQLNSYPNCKLNKTPCDIKSLYFWFDQCDDVIPSVLTFYNGKGHIDYEDVRIVRITSDIGLHKTYDEDNNYYLYYDCDYVRNNYKHYLTLYQRFRTLVGSYIIDWKKNLRLIEKLKKCKSQYIELNYHIFDPNNVE